MKNILIPTDFSETAINATNYAMEIAKLTKAKVILFHVFHIPMVHVDLPMTLTTFDDLEKSTMNILRSYEKDLISRHGKGVTIERIIKPGFVVDEVRDIIGEKEIDLIVMGITGEGKFAEVIIGSNATEVIKNVNCPTLIIPQNARFKRIENIAFACDYEEISESKALGQLKKFLKLFNAKLLIFNVVNPSRKPSFAKAVTGVKLESIFEDVNHDLYFPENDDLVYAINDFVDKHNIAILVMLSKKHNLFTNMFQERSTKKMAFHSHVPLLTIHN